MKQIIISLKAVMAMINDCYKAGKNLETGGVLVGPKNNKGIITDVIPSSAHAEREAYTYYQSEEDVKGLNLKLREFQAVGFDFKGYYHQHPSGMSRLSTGDLGTCTDILKDKKDNNLLMIIITETSDPHQFPIFLYRVFLNKCQRPVVKSLPYKVLPQGCMNELINA